MSKKRTAVGQTEMFSKIPGSLSELLYDNDYKQFLKNLGLDTNDLRLNERLDDKKFMNDLIHGKGEFAPIGGIMTFLEEEGITIEMLQQRRSKYKGYKDWSDYFKNSKLGNLNDDDDDEDSSEDGIYPLMWDIFNSVKMASNKKTKKNTKNTKRSHKRCKECRCKPCKCKEDIHCYQITCDDKKTKKKKKKKKKKSQKGGILPLCVPCWAGPALAVTGLGSAGYMVSRSSSSKTVNGKTVSERKESYKIKKNGKKIKKTFKQLNNRIYLNGSELKPRPKTMKEGTKRLNKKITECVKSGFRKC